jgi:electron transfer flavoprotein alpha subunit
MRIAVCVKWVPVIARLKFDTETKRIVREGVPSEVNPFDLLAVQRAIELRDSHGGDVAVYTMGPPPARQALVQCLAMGADRAFHLTDRALAGSDTLATSRALSLALALDSYDLVLFGAYSTDSETGQVGPEVAELLGWAQVTGVSKLDVAGGSNVVAEREVDEGYEVVECRLPAVVSVVEGVAEELFPGREALQAAAEREILELSAVQLFHDVGIFGEAGSPTWVAEIQFVESQREKVLITETEPREAARQVVAFLKERGLLDSRRPRKHLSAPPASLDVRPAEGPGVWVMAELGSTGVRAVTHELLGAAQSIADAVGGHVVALLMGGPDVGRHAPELAHAGADLVHVAADDSLADYTTEAYAQTLAAAMVGRNPYAVLVPSTLNGRDVAARVAARLGLGLTGDCIGFEIDDEGRLVQMKPAFGGNVVAPIISKTRPYMATVRPGLLQHLQPNEGRQAPVVPIAVQSPDDPGVRVISTRRDESADAAELDDAWAVVAVGMGMEAPENIAALGPLVEALGATLACTRDLADAGWMPKQRQVGLTGRSIAPDLYIGVGVRGDFNHTVGIQRAGTVVAINNNKRALIFRGADIGVVDDWRNIVPALAAELRRELG